MPSRDVYVLEIPQVGLDFFEVTGQGELLDQGIVVGEEVRIQCPEEIS
jgi:hypothetical protein